MGAICAAGLIVLIGLAAIRPVARFAAFVIAAAWTALIFGIAALGGFAPGVTGPFPGPVVAFLVLMIGGLVAWMAWPAFRNAFLSLPLAGLAGINAFRIGGICFLILHDRGRLAAPFAFSAGWGDIITGLAAIPLAGMAAWKGKLPRGLLTVWNVFGALDLIVAILLGALSAPGTPFRLFPQAPGTVVMGTLPWVVVPTLLVPLYLMSHLAIAVRLRSAGLGRATAPGQVDNRPQDTLTRMAA
ncbi:MAG: hypothetical protein ACE15B_10575 [Bryobacteraceae bacterium]